MRRRSIGEVRRAHRTLGRIRAAVDRDDHEEVIHLGEALLAEDALPTDAVAYTRLTVGMAHFHTGAPGRALEHLAGGLSHVTDSLGRRVSGLDVIAHLYTAGMCAMILGRLGEARDWLGRAREQRADGSWARDAALRGLAQVEAELGNLDAAMATLAELPEAAESQVLHEVIRATVLRRVGRLDEARWALLVGTGALLDHPDDVPSGEHATLASMMVSMAIEYVELGHGEEAAAVIEEARRRQQLSGRPDLTEALYLPVLDAEVRRLRDDLEAAGASLEGGPRSHPDVVDLEPMWRREGARFAWARGDREDAVALWAEAAAGFEAIGYQWMAADVRRESEEGPPVAVPHPEMDELARRVWGDAVRDGLVVTFTVTGDHGTDAEREELLSLAEELAASIEDAGAGEFDGWGSGGGDLEVFAFGDPGQLWVAVEAQVRQVATRYPAVVTFQRAGEVTHHDL